MKRKQVIVFSVLAVIILGTVGYLGYFFEEPLLAPASEEETGEATSASSTIQLTAFLSAIIIDDFDTQTSEIQFYLVKDDGSRLRAYPANPNINLESLVGERLLVTGRNSELDEGPGFFVESVQIPIREGVEEDFVDSVLGEQKVAVVLIKNGPNYIYQTPQFYQNLVFNETGLYKANNWVREVSYGRAWLDGDVYGWYDIHQGENCGFVLTGDFLNELIGLGINLQEYDYLHVIRPGNCHASGFGTLGKSSYLTSIGIIEIGISLTASTSNSEDYIAGIIVHELGHNFGLGHANRFHCYGDILRSGCLNFEYNNFYNHMGPLYFQSFDSPHKNLIGWFNSGDVVEISQSGEYTIKPYEITSATPKVIKIKGFRKDIAFVDAWGNNRSGKISNFYVEFRRPLLYDDFFSGTGWWSSQNLYVPNDYQDGAYLLFTLEENSRISPWSHQVDLNPGQPRLPPNFPFLFDATDVILREGRTADLTNYGFSLTTLEVNNEYLKVRIEFTECRDGKDNDKDGLIDYPNDPDCISPNYNSEAPTLCYAIRTDGNFYNINQENATLTLISNTGLFAGALEASRNGKLYVVTVGNTAALHEINPRNGTTRLIGNLNRVIVEGGLAIAPNNNAYVVMGESVGEPRLLSLDLNTGTTNVIGRISGVNRDISGLTWRNDNMLVGLDSVTNSLLVINPVNANASVLTSLTPIIGDVGGITSTDGEIGFFATTSVHQSGSDELYSVNLYTGEYNLIGNLGSRTGEPGVSGLACTHSQRSLRILQNYP